jgi:hypothetical protein
MATKYFKADGAKNCHANAMITTEAECRKAAATIHGDFYMVVTEDATSHNGSGRPAGCYWNQNYHPTRVSFNTNLKSSSSWQAVGGLCETPTAALTMSPTAAPTASPTAAPTGAPTAAPMAALTMSPTTAPTATPTVAPTVAPTSTWADMQSSYGGSGSSGSSYGGPGSSGGSNGPIHVPMESKNDLLAQLKAMVRNLTTVDPATHEALNAKIDAAVAAPCDSSGGTDDSGAMEKVSCTRMDNSGLDVSFLPFENAFKPDFPMQLAAAKAQGTRVCFCA